MDKSGQWHNFPHSTRAIQGRHQDELFLGTIEGGFFSPSAKLTKVLIVDKQSGKGRAVSAASFRSVLWPAARAAYDRWGAVAFFRNPVDRPGYAADPAYIISGLELYTDKEDVEAGTSAIVFPDGRVFTKPFHWNPLIATTTRGKTMYVLTDDSYYNEMGWNERDLLHLMKVDRTHGLVRVGSVENATGVSYAFAD